MLYRFNNHAAYLWSSSAGMLVGLVVRCLPLDQGDKRYSLFYSLPPLIIYVVPCV